MKNSFKILVFIAIVFSLSCNKTIDDSVQPISIDDIIVADDFSWDAYNDIKLIVNVENEKRYEILSRISVYNGNPASGGQLMTVGSSSPDNPFESTIRLPQTLTEIYLKYESAFGPPEIVVVAISGNTIDYTFSSSTKEIKANTLNGDLDIGPGCDDCDQEVSGSDNVVINNGQVVCVTSSFNGTVTFETWNGGGTLKICGDATINSLTLGDASHLVVTQDGTLTVNSISMWSDVASITIYENAIFTVNSQFQTMGDYVDNQGVMVVNGDLVIQNLSSGTFTNSGTINVSGFIDVNNGVEVVNTGLISATGNHIHFNTGSSGSNSGTINFNSPGNFMQINTGSSLTNDGEVNVTGSLNINTGSTIVNNCKMICTETMAINSSSFTTTSGYLKGAQFIHITSGAIVTLNTSSMISTTDLTLDGSSDIVGTGDLNSIKVTGTFTINDINTVSGPVESATDNLIFWVGTQDDHFINGATLVGLNDVTNYIPVHECNPEGVGSPITTDSDLDGVADNQDDYPYDPERAYNNYYPAQGEVGSLAFEDYWPHKGDNDFNDLVLNYNSNHVTNANNDVVEIVAVITIKAIGAGYKNGFGFQLPISPASVENVTGFILTENFINLSSNNTEDSQNKATIIAFDNTYSLFPNVGSGFVNTDYISPYVNPESVTLTISFVSPMSQDDIGLPPYNPFLIVNKERGLEIHLPDYEPTSLVNSSYFGTEDDNSVPLMGRYYKTIDNLPWAIHLTEDFDYPLEKFEITKGHLYFGTWAQSSGMIKQNWYKDEDGNRDNDYIYQINGK